MRLTCPSSSTQPEIPGNRMNITSAFAAAVEREMGKAINTYSHKTGLA